MIAGLLGSKTTGLSQFRRDDVVVPNAVIELPPSVDRLQEPFCEQAYTLFWLVGSIRFCSPSPPRIEFQLVPPQERTEPLSCRPPEIRERSCLDTAAV